MDRWKYTCVGCGNTLDVSCNNCGRELFKGRKKGDHKWLECVHCKEKNNDMLHICSYSPEFRGKYIGDPYRPEVIHKRSRTDLNVNREFFFKVEGFKLTKVKMSDLIMLGIFVVIILMLWFVFI